MRGKEMGDSGCTSPSGGRKETAESEKVPNVGSRLFQCRTSWQCSKMNLGKMVKTVWLSEVRGGILQSIHYM